MPKCVSLSEPWNQMKNLTKIIKQKDLYNLIYSCDLKPHMIGI